MRHQYKPGGFPWLSVICATLALVMSAAIHVYAALNHQFDDYKSRRLRESYIREIYDAPGFSRRQKNVVADCIVAHKNPTEARKCLYLAFDVE
jgi:hypothetical protein